MSLSNTAVVGLQWGDEGKGKIVDLLSEQFDYIVRYNGGANAGHTVVVGDQRYALHLLPSGILQQDKTNVIGNGVVIDPEKLIDEIRQLTERGLTIGENLRISDRAHVVLPYHKMQDNLLEGALSAARGDGKKIGTTGRGIGPAYADKATRSLAIRMADLIDPQALAEKLQYIVTVKNAMLAALADLNEQEFAPLNAEELIDTYSEYGRKLKPHVCDSSSLLHEALARGEHLLFEGANACMLDLDHGTFPYVTSSNCSSLGIYAGTGLPGGTVKQVVGIVKAYTTRVGGGPFATELDDEVGNRIRERGHEYGTTTGRPRRCGWLDLCVIRYSARICGATQLSIMLLDVMAGFDELKICTGYRYRDQVLADFPSSASVLEQVEPIYETMPGFAQEITDCRHFNDLPQQARAYVQKIEQVVGIPVAYVSVGPERSQTLKIER